MADKFVLVRLLRVTGVDLNIFDFDCDLTWAGFFLRHDNLVYGRYGGRDSSGPDDRQSLAGLRHAMKGALEAHKRDAKKPAPKLGKADRAETYSGRRRGRGRCIHCHQVSELRRQARKKAGTWKREDAWGYPLPENVGLTLEVDQGDKVKAVKAGSPAAKAGVKAGDVVTAVNGVNVSSQADFQYGLHRAPWKGKVTIAWKSGDKAMSAQMDLADGWKKTNHTWRPSLLDLLPSLTVYGDDLTAAEKKKLGLSPETLAFRQQKKVHSQAKAAGVQAGDVILGLDGQTHEMTVDGFLAHVRLNYFVGEKITLVVLRDGKRVKLPFTLK